MNAAQANKWLPPADRMYFTQAALSAYGSGCAVVHISNMLGISRGTIERWLREYNFPKMLDDRRGDRSSRWTGGRSIVGGYVRLYITSHDPRMRKFETMIQRKGRTPRDGGQVYEHRLVMAEALGRPLQSNETVHHLNGDGLDNRIENLELYPDQHGPRQRWVCANCGSSDRKAVSLKDTARQILQERGDG